MTESTRNSGSDSPTEGDDPHTIALKHANEAWTAEAENFDNARDDQRFYAGEQWLADAKMERTLQNRPVITINRIPGFVKQVTGDARKDTPAIKVAPAKDGASEEVAEIYNGLIRNIENNSNAKSAYVQALENACITGMGAFRIKTQYSDDDSFDQDIVIERLTDPFQVLFDPAARKPDKSDGRYALVFVDMPKEVFQEKFPDATLEGMPSGPNAIQGLSWFSMESVRIAEYWYKKPVTKKLFALADGRVIDAEEALRETKAGQPIEVVQKREVETHEVCMRLMNGKEFLSKESPWAGKDIPICPVIGEEIYIEGRCVRRGMVRDAKDAQRVYNYMRTAAVEAAALQPKMPWLVTLDMIKGDALTAIWNSAGSKNLPYLPYLPDPKAPGNKPERAQPALAQAGLDSQAQLAGEDLQAVVGIYNVSLGAQSNETSGRAINARNAQADTGSFNYIDNLGTAIRHCGSILVDIIPKIYDTPRIVRVLKEDGSAEMQRVNHPMSPEGQPLDPNGIEPEELEAIEKMNDLTVGKYDVTVIVGKSFATRRMESQEAIIDLMRNVPAIAEIASDVLIKNLDFPGADEIAKRIEDKQNQGPDPTKVAEVAKTASEIKLNEAKAEETLAKALGEGVGALQLIQQMHMTMQQMQSQLAGLAGTPPQPGAAPAGPAAPPEAPPAEAGPPPDLEPMQPPEAAGQMPELEPMQPQGAQ